jgi:uncharacterized protein (DUF885 family)
MKTSGSELAQLFADHWEAWMKWDPIFATQCGDQRYNDRLPNADESHYADWLTQLEGFRARLEQIASDSLKPADRLNYDYFARMLSSEMDELRFGAYRLPISKLAGFHTTFPTLYMYMPFEKVGDYENYLARLNAVRGYFAQSMELMRRALDAGFIPPRVTLDGVVESIEAQIVAEAEQSPFYEPFKQFPHTVAHAEREKLSAAAKESITGAVVPAYEALLQFIREEYAPRARQSTAIAEIPNGREFYRHRVRYFTTLDLTPEEIHAMGHAEVQRIRAEMEDAIRKSGFAGSFKEFVEFLRTDPRFYAETPEALLKETAYILKRIDGELPKFFKSLPRLPYGILPVPDFLAPGTTTAYYMQGTGDGTKGGMYYVNTYNLKSRPLYEMEALSLHEAVPGHHLQISLQQEMADLPAFRRFYVFHSYIEGWALYSERLGLEMGFYTDPYSDFGRLSYEMWRACRLVVDTGLHALGWTRQQAIDFMAENTALTLLNIANEVDRYIALPAQALAYKIGEIKIRALRERAEQRLGANFNLRDFHDVILLGGALPLDVLEARVEKWMEGEGE